MTEQRLTISALQDMQTIMAAAQHPHVAKAIGELIELRELEERLEAVMKPDCPGFESACRALWDREPHHLLARHGYPVDFDSQPAAIRAGLKRQVMTVLRAISAEVKRG